MPAFHHSSFFTGQMPFLPPNQQHQSTEGNLDYHSSCAKVLNVLWVSLVDWSYGLELGLAIATTTGQTAQLFTFGSLGSGTVAEQ